MSFLCVSEWYVGEWYGVPTYTNTYFSSCSFTVCVHVRMLIHGRERELKEQRTKIKNLNVNWEGLLAGK